MIVRSVTETEVFSVLNVGELLPFLALVKDKISQ